MNVTMAQVTVRVRKLLFCQRSFSISEKESVKKIENFSTKLSADEMSTKCVMFSPHLNGGNEGIQAATMNNHMS